MGDVKRKILINDYDEDVFSDDIKTNAIIEEIEEAEFAARQVQIDRQIDASQPTLLQKIWANISEKRHNIKKTAAETIAHLRTKRPDDPRVEKRSLLKQADMASKKMATKLRRPRIIINHSNQVVVKNTHAPKLHFWRDSRPKLPLTAKMQNVEVSRKSVVQLCITSVLIVVAAELWAWNFIHPLYRGQNVDKIPVTGSADTSGMVIDDGETANAPEKPSQTETESSKNETASEIEQQDSEPAAITEPNAANNYRYYGGANSAAPQQTSANTSKRSTSAANNTKRPATSTKQNNTVNIDSNWNDKYAENWPPVDQENIDESDHISDDTDSENDTGNTADTDNADNAADTADENNTSNHNEK